MTGTEEKPAPVVFADLVDAFDFVNFGAAYENYGYICRKTGRIYTIVAGDGVDGDEDEDVPDGIEESEDYISIPYKNDLNLGTRLVFDFAAEEMPADEARISNMFRRSGGWRRFKDLLASKNMLDRWYAYETRRPEAALRAWCESEDIETVELPSG